MSEENKILKKRIYSEMSEEDGFRVLVDRLWPRGISKEKAHIDIWKKEIAPSNDLRKWFNHDTEKYDEFREKYFEELKNNKAAQEFKAWAAEKLHEDNITLLFSAKDEEHNNATVLREWLY